MRSNLISVTHYCFCFLELFIIQILIDINILVSPSGVFTSLFFYGIRKVSYSECSNASYSLLDFFLAKGIITRQCFKPSAHKCYIILFLLIYSMFVGVSDLGDQKSIPVQLSKKLMQLRCFKYWNKRSLSCLCNKKLSVAQNLDHNVLPNPILEL